MIRPFLVPTVGMPFAVAIVDKTTVFRFSNRSNPLLMRFSTKTPHQIPAHLLERVLLLPLREIGDVVRPHRLGQVAPAVHVETLAHTIRLNTELAKKPPECLEYIVVHELVHLLEPTHNAHFVALMDRFMAKWQFHRQVLNRLPVRGETWSY